MFKLSGCKDRTCVKFKFMAKLLSVQINRKGKLKKKFETLKKYCLRLTLLSCELRSTILKKPIL